MADIKISYAWIITKDHLADLISETNRQEGLIGPSDASDELIARLRAGRGRAFRIYDDDGELYYSGRIIVSNTLEDGSVETEYDLTEECFGPLWDYAGPADGATEIRYFVGGKLVTL